MAYRNKTYVAFDADRDIRYYHLMKAWKDNDHADFNFFDAHDLKQARDTSSEETIKASLRVRMSNAKIFVLLVGESTRYLFKFVRWEIESALRRDLPIIVVNLNGLRKMDTVRCPPILRGELAIHISFQQAIVQYALDHWPSEYQSHKKKHDTGAYYYKPLVYERLGL